MESIKKKLMENGAWTELTRALLTVIRDRPADPLKAIESIFAKTKPASDPIDQKAKDAAIAALTGALNLMSPPPPAKGPEGEEPEPEAPPAEMPFIPNMLDNAASFQAAGIDFGEGEMYRVSLSIHDFAIEQAKLENNFKSIRFFGKVLGTSKDYYVIECGKEEWPEPGENDAKIPEPMGTGTNQYQYWVSNTAGAGSTWTALPPVTPEMLAAARKCRKFFTGDINAAVRGYPYFKWKEAGYLRAQIAEITHATVISPVGVWVEEEEADEPKPIKLNEGFTPPKISTMLTTAKWVHHRAFIMPEIGMCVPPEVEGEEEDKKGNPVKLLTSVEKDPRSNGQWKIELCSSFGVRPEENPNAVVSATSLVWPGATCVWQKTSIVNVYVGYGHKRSETAYKAASPPVPQEEFKLPPDQADPIKPKEEAKEQPAEEEKKEE